VIIVQEYVGGFWNKTLSLKFNYNNDDRVNQMASIENGIKVNKKYGKLLLDPQN
jgi:hypothetical protein